jgi:hypothetical protein
MNEDMINVRRLYPTAVQKRYSNTLKFWVIAVKKNECAILWLGTGKNPRVAWKRAWDKIATSMVKKLES